MWQRAIECGLMMKKQTGASFLDLYKAAKGMTKHGGLNIAQAMMAASAPMLIQRAVVEGDGDGGLMATGQVAGRLGDLPTCHDLIDNIIGTAEARLRDLQALPLDAKGAA